MMLYPAYEDLILRAALDPAFGAHLVADPPRVALQAGYCPLLAESLVGLRATTLAGFAHALHQRVYGYPPGADGVHRWREGQPRPESALQDGVHHSQRSAYPQTFRPSSAHR